MAGFPLTLVAALYEFTYLLIVIVVIIVTTTTTIMTNTAGCTSERMSASVSKMTPRDDDDPSVSETSLCR